MSDEFVSPAPRVAVLGCGPAGLLAALAARQAGARVQIFSRKIKSEIGGAQYLHRSIPEITSDDPDDWCEFIKLGAREIYASKVYGDALMPCSWDDYDEGEHAIWNMRQAYDNLWNMFEPDIVDITMERAQIPHLVAGYNLVISSIPLPVLAPHAYFEWQPVWIFYTEMKHTSHNNSIVWSGENSELWYRGSELFGWMSLEYGKEEAHRAPHKTRLVKKPLRSHGAKDIFPQILRVGRYGEFRKGVLIHDAYERTEERMKLLMEGE